MTTLKLRTPIKEGGKEIAEITFRKPTGKDVRQCGVPDTIEVTAQGGQLHRTDTEAGARLISALCNIPPSTVDQMDLADFTRALGIINGFFMEAATEPTSSPDAGSSHASTEQAQTPST